MRGSDLECLCTTVVAFLMPDGGWDILNRIHDDTPSDSENAHHLLVDIKALSQGTKITYRRVSIDLDA